MSEELLPCPFCGGEVIEYEPKGDSFYWEIRCNRCHFGMKGTNRSMNQDKWNTRAERTCTMSWTDHEYEDSLRCSACKETVPFMRGGYYKFCPNCGAMVMPND